jgi:hypothetical protein
MDYVALPRRKRKIFRRNRQRINRSARRDLALLAAWRSRAAAIRRQGMRP